MDLPFLIGTEPYVTVFTLLNLGMNGFFVVALMSFVERLGNKNNDEKVFKKTIWNKKS